jgi:branched-chain amino acid transport system substrate-binding protein
VTGRRRLGSFLALLLVVSLGAASCGSDAKTAAPSGSTSGSSKVLGPLDKADGTPVKIAVISDGQMSTGDTSYEAKVIRAEAKWLNDHRKGIAGHPIDLVVCETRGDPGKAADCANQVIEQDVTAVITGQLRQMETVWKPLHEAKVPVIFYGANGDQILADRERTFSLASNTAPVVLPALVAKQKGVKKKVAIAVLDVPAATELYEDTAPALFEELGVEFEVFPIPPGVPDVTPQMQRIASGGFGVVHLVADPSACIAILNGLRNVGAKVAITTLSFCVDDATRAAVGAENLAGVVMSATSPAGLDNADTRLYKAILDTYADGFRPQAEGSAMNSMMPLGALSVALEDLQGDLTPESLVTGLHQMTQKQLPFSGGLTFRCNGKANPASPAICVRGSLVATLDKAGKPGSYDKVGDTPIPD